MEKNFLVFSNGEKIGDGIIKLQLLHEIKKRFPDHKLIWMTNKGNTVYNNQLKNLASFYIDEIIEKANLNPFFWNKISKNYNLNNVFYEYIFDTQKAIYRTAALKRIKCKNFLSSAGNGFFSSFRLNLNKSDKRKYYLNDLFDLLNILKVDTIDSSFKIAIPANLQNKLKVIFNRSDKYLGIAPGAGEKNKIWPLEKFIKLGKYFESKNFKIVLFLGPDETSIKERLISEFPEALMPEQIVKNFSNIEIVMGSTRFLTCALANDSGISHMLSTKHCPLIKLFGPKDSNKFTPEHVNLKSITSTQFNSSDVKIIPIEEVIKVIECSIS
jgi:ADP-heptose:LPS heptosyltransferase